MSMKSIVAVVKVSLFAMVVALCFTGCAKYELEDGGGDMRLTFRVSPFEKSDFDVNPSRATVGVGEVCSRLSLVVFDVTGKKVKTVNQESTDEGFGTLAANVNSGTYDVVIIGHSTDGNPTISKPDSIRFKDNKLSDMFSYYERLTVGDYIDKGVTLKRSVAMFRLRLTEAVPAEVKQLKFYYTGGSSALNATTNLGKIQSRQTEILDVGESAHTETCNVFEVYTIPHEVDDLLKMDITPLDANGNALGEGLTFESVPVSQGKITTYEGRLFDRSDVVSPLNIAITVDDDWEETVMHF